MQVLKLLGREQSDVGHDDMGRTSMGECLFQSHLELNTGKQILHEIIRRCLNCASGLGRPVYFASIVHTFFVIHCFSRVHPPWP